MGRYDFVSFIFYLAALICLILTIFGPVEPEQYIIGLILIVGCVLQAQIFELKAKLDD